MKSNTMLDSLVFQLTPTRTRCDLVISANGKTEKIASGLLEPFLSHLKTARDQIAKGGYSITLKPDPKNDVTWFTKGTVDRFVRFVNTPEVLERVDTIESEMFQIEEAIAVQNNENLGLSTQLDDHQSKHSDNVEGSKPILDAGSDKAIVLFKPGAQPTESNGSTTPEENSKVQLLRVLEARKIVLQKEQGMAFARAVAAGFDMEHLAYLLLFAEFFGASRLMQACMRFMELWKRKHETGQWLEIEANEAMSCRSDFYALNTSGLVFSGETRSEKEFGEESHESHGELCMDNNGKTSNGTSKNMSTSYPADHMSDNRSPINSQSTSSPHEYYQAHFQHPMYPPWPMPSAYPMQSMPYYQNYHSTGPYFRPPYPPMEDPRFNGPQMMGQKKYSMDSKDSNTELEAWEMGVSNERSQDSTDQSTSEKEIYGRKSRRRAGRLGKTKSGVVVVRNINYITSKRHDISSESDSATDEDPESDLNTPERRHKNSMKSSKGKMNNTKSTDNGNSDNKDSMVSGQEADGGNWQAFQNFLLRDDHVHNDHVNVNDSIVFSAEKGASVERGQNKPGLDPILDQRDSGEVADKWSSGFDMVSGEERQMYKQRASKMSNEHFHSSGGSVWTDGKLDLPLSELENQRGHQREICDEFLPYRQGTLPFTGDLTDPLSGHEFVPNDNNDKSSLQNAPDESFIVPFRSNSQDQIGSDRRAAIDIDMEFPSAPANDDACMRVSCNVNYEPDDLSLMPDRGTERESNGYDPAVDYEMEIQTEDTIAPDSGNQDVSIAIQELQISEKRKKSKLHDASEKRKTEATLRKGKPLKSNSFSEAQLRAEKLRVYKADLQKIKREKEEEEMKRLEALKRERQKRIAARGGSSSSLLPSSSLQTKSQLPTKLSPGLHKGLKFTDSDSGSSSPMQRFPSKIASPGSNDSQKVSKSSRLNATVLARNGLSRSVSSLSELKKEDPGLEPKASPVQTRRLSEPKGCHAHRATTKSRSSDSSLSKAKSPPESEIKISAIKKLDRTKSATLPELKIETSRSDQNISQNKPVVKDIKQKENGSKSSRRSETIKHKKNIEKSLPVTSADHSPIIEKNIVTLEHEVCAIPVIQTSKENSESQEGVYNESSRQAAVLGENVGDASASNTVSIDEKNPSGFHFDIDLRLKKVEMDHAIHESSMPQSLGIEEKVYQAPFARATSLEDPCTSNSEYINALPLSSEVERAIEPAKAQVLTSMDPASHELIPGSMEKPRGKDSSKGFRRLLKFGRKNHGSTASERNIDPDKFSIDGLALEDHAGTGGSPGEVHLLKNLISQDDGSMPGASHKASRHFSLLSPFWGKNTEKKLAT